MKKLILESAEFCLVCWVELPPIALHLVQVCDSIVLLRADILLAPPAWRHAFDRFPILKRVLEVLQLLGFFRAEKVFVFAFFEQHSQSIMLLRVQSVKPGMILV